MFLTLAKILLLTNQRISLLLVKLWLLVRYRNSSPKSLLIQSSLAEAYPNFNDKKIQELTKKCVIDDWLNQVRQYRLQILPRKMLLNDLDKVEIEGIKILSSSKNQKRPTIFITAHYGGFMLAGLVVARFLDEKKLCFFYNPEETNPYSRISDKLVKKINANCESYHNSPRGILKSIRSLRKGGSLCVVIDQTNKGGEILYVQLLGACRT